MATTIAQLCRAMDRILLVSWGVEHDYKLANGERKKGKFVMPGLLKKKYADATHVTVDLRQLWQNDPGLSPDDQERGRGALCKGLVAVANKVSSHTPASTFPIIVIQIAALLAGNPAQDEKVLARIAKDNSCWGTLRFVMGIVKAFDDVTASGQMVLSLVCAPAASSGSPWVHVILFGFVLASCIRPKLMRLHVDMSSRLTRPT